jgi:recombinational DNA repair ATPase RecF
MLTSITINNFKSWKAVRDMRLAPFTGLFGTNSSGKTSLLQLLLLLKQTVESPDRAQVLNLVLNGINTLTYIIVDFLVANRHICTKEVVRICHGKALTRLFYLATKGQHWRTAQGNIR